MTCPSCGGTNRKPISPGYWECATVIDDPTIVKSAWDVTDPWRAATFPKRPCGHRYREGASVPTEPCRCGIYSIGRCGKCNEPVCGDHGLLYADTLHCKRCAQALFEAEQKRQQEAVERAKRVAKAKRDELEMGVKDAIRRATEALGASGRLPERIAAVEQITTPGTGGPGGGRPGKSWLVIEREMGLGWYVGRFVYARLVLTEDGRLLEGSGAFGRWDKAEDGFHLRVRPGAFFPRFKKPVLAVKPDEFDLEQCEDNALRHLRAGLLEIAAGRHEPLRWSQK